MKHRFSSLSDDTGAMLITVMLCVAIMSAVAVTVIENIRMSVRLAGNAHRANQARWYALASETWARDALTSLVAAQEGDKKKEKPASVAPTLETVMTIDAMHIAGTLAPLPNCFNLNSLVSPDEDSVLKASKPAAQQFQRLLVALGLPSDMAEHLVAATTDWIDPDTELSAFGAEDYDYSGLTVPYRTGNSLMADVSELRTVKGFTREIYAQVRPYVCALRTTEMNGIDVNRLTAEEAPLMAMLFDASPVRSATALILAARPLQGFATIDDVWAIPDLSEIDIKAEAKGLLGLEARYYRLQTVVTADDFAMDMSALFDTKENENRMLVWRQFGEEM